MTAISLSRAMSSTWPGSTICTSLLGSRTILLLASSRHSPAAFITVRPLGKREKISLSRKRLHSASFTPRRPPMLRPNISSATWVECWSPRQSTNCASALPLSARTRVNAETAHHGPLPRKRQWEQIELAARARSISSKSTLSADALDGGAAGRELVLEPLEAAVEMIDAVDDGLALGRKRRNDERDRGTQIGGHDRRALERAHALDGGALAVELDMRSEPHQLLHVHEAVLEDGLADARGSFGPRHQRHQLRLQVGRESGKRRGGDLHRREA